MRALWRERARPAEGLLAIKHRRVSRHAGQRRGGKIAHPGSSAADASRAPAVRPSAISATATIRVRKGACISWCPDRDALWEQAVTALVARRRYRLVNSQGATATVRTSAKQRDRGRALGVSAARYVCGAAATSSTRRLPRSR